MPGAEGVDGEGALGVALASVDRSPGAGVDDGVRLQGGDGLEDLVAVGHVEVTVGRGHHVVAVESLDQIGPQLSVPAGDQYAHLGHCLQRLPPPAVVPIPVHRLGQRLVEITAG